MAPNIFRALRFAVCLTMVGCASSVQSVSLDAYVTDGANDAEVVREVEVAGRVDGNTCDPTIFPDAGEDDVPSDGPTVVELAVASAYHQCARMSDGTVRCRGFNTHGQLGIGAADTMLHASAPVPGLSDVEQVVTASPYNTCTRHRDGTVRCWGWNQYDMLGTGHAEDEMCPGFMGPTPCRTSPTVVPGLTDVVHLAEDALSFCAVRRDGSVWCWGHVLLQGLLGTSMTPSPAQGLSDVVWMRSIFGVWILRTREGRFLEDPPASMHAIPDGVEIAEGPHNDHVCWRLPDTSVRCLGLNADGKVGNGTATYPSGVTEPWNPGLCGVRSIVTGAYHTCALLSDHTASCWGSNQYGGLGAMTAEQCPGIISRSQCATHPTPVAGLDHIDRLFAGVWGTCALRSDHTVWCWGSLAPSLSEFTPTLVQW